jgi:hypothetical protein
LRPNKKRCTIDADEGYHTKREERPKGVKYGKANLRDWT